LVGLDVASGSLYEWRCNATAGGGYDFVAHEKASRVVVLGEGIHDCGEILKLGLIPLWGVLQVQLSVRVSHLAHHRFTYLRNLCSEGIHINEQVDSSILKSRHASVVVAASVNVVYANGIGAELLHECGIELALVLV